MTNLKVTPLHPTFAAELSGVDFTKPISPEMYAVIREIVDKVGFLQCGCTCSPSLTWTVRSGRLQEHPLDRSGSCRILKVFRRARRCHALHAGRQETSIANEGAIRCRKYRPVSTCTHKRACLSCTSSSDVVPALTKSRDTNEVAATTHVTVVGNLANELFHVDSSFNARRAGHSLLLSHILPPKGTGGATEVSGSLECHRF